MQTVMSSYSIPYCSRADKPDVPAQVLQLHHIASSIIHRLFQPAVIDSAYVANCDGKLAKDIPLNFTSSSHHQPTVLSLHT